MSTQASDQVINHRYDFVLFFDVTRGNPNGDPDAGNLPRTDPEDQHGLVTDGCIKRKVRDFVLRKQGGAVPYDIYVKHRGILANEQKRAYEELGIQPTDKAPSKDPEAWMCKNYFDIRTFGAVMTTGKAKIKDAKGKDKDVLYNCGQVRGPVQIGIARSLDPITPLDIAITRVALTNASDIERGEAAETADAEVTEARAGQIGRKSIVPYGLYRVHGFISPSDAKKTRFNQADLALLWESLARMFDVDHSASRGEMSSVALFAFEHTDNAGLGCCQSKLLFQLLTCTGKVAVPRTEADYEGPSLDGKKLPKGVIAHRWDFLAGKMVEVGRGEAYA